MGVIRNLLYPRDIEVHTPTCDIKIPVLRWSRHLDEAQMWLTQQVAADCTNFIPFESGVLRSSLTFPEGLEGGVIEWNTPYAHYQNEGEVYINPQHNASGFVGSDGLWYGWRGPKVPSGRPIQYHTEGTGDHWVEKAKEAYMDSWVKGARRVAFWGR